VLTCCSIAVGVNAMKRIAIGVITLGLLTGPVFAQKISDDPIILDQQMKKKDREELDQKYRATLRRTDQGQTVTRIDPWQNMRAPTDANNKH